MNKPFILLALCTALIGCGGGGGPGGAGQSAPAPSGDSNDAAAEAPQPTAVTQMNDLAVDQRFVFSSSFPVGVSIDVSTSNPDADYVTVCLPSASEPTEPDFGNCLVRSELDDGRLSGEFQITGNTTRVFTVLWDFANPSAPVTRSFEVAPGGEPIVL